MSRKLILKRKDESTLTLAGLDAFLARLLHEIPAAGEPGPACESRFFPAPTRGVAPQVDGDWKNFVRPELEASFSESRNRIAEDLKRIREVGRGGYELDVPRENRWEWVHGLNQARLALATIHGLGEQELDRKVPMEASASFAAFQIQFYALLQEWFLAEEEGDGAESD